MDDRFTKKDKIITRLNISAFWKVETAPGGKPTLTDQEASSALCGLPVAYYELGYMYLTQEYHNYNKVVLSVMNEAVEKSIKNKWKFPRGKQLIYKMSGLAVVETLAPKLCKKCLGHGKYSNKKKLLIVECNKCMGSGGGKSFSDKAKSKLLDLDEDNYRKNWSVKYETIHSIPYSWLNYVFDHIERKT